MSACPACRGIPCRCRFTRPAAPSLYHIRIQRRCEYNGRFSRHDWRAYREYLVWPKTFPTRAAAEKFMTDCFTFAGITGRKVSASVAQCGALLLAVMFLGGWASQDQHADKRIERERRVIPRFDRQIDQELIDQNRLYEFWMNQQHQERERRCRNPSIRYRCSEAYE